MTLRHLPIINFSSLFVMNKQQFMKFVNIWVSKNSQYVVLVFASKPRCKEILSEKSGNNYIISNKAHFKDSFHFSYPANKVFLMVSYLTTQNFRS